MTTLKVRYEDQSEIPQGLEDYFQEQDGVYVLQAEGLKTDDDVSKVKETLDKERKARRDAEKKLKESQDKLDALPEDFDVEEYERLKAAGGNEDVNAKIEEARERERKRWQKSYEQLKQERDEAVQTSRNKSISTALKDGLNSVNIAPHLRRAAERLWMADIEVDEQGEPVTKDGTPLQDALKDWANTDEGRHFVAASANNGGGAEGKGNGKGVTSNPFKRETRNLTEQARLKREAPQEAQRLAKDAGVALE